MKQLVPHTNRVGDDVPVRVPGPALVTVMDGVPEGGGGGGGGDPLVVKAAVTLDAAFIVTVHEPVPLQAPLQPAKADPLLPVGVSVTTVPRFKLALQLAPQLMPAGEVGRASCRG